MQAAFKSEFVSVADYLAAEATSDVRHPLNWKAETISGAKAKLRLESLRVTLPLPVVYEGV